MSKDRGSKSKDDDAMDITFDPTVVETKLKTWFSDLSGEVIKKLVRFQGHLVQFNPGANLVPSGTLKGAESLHIADCVLGSRLVASHLSEDSPLFDFGGGNGLPGIVLGILNPNFKVVLVDKDSKKLEFSKHVLGELKLGNVSILSQGIEDLPEKSVIYGITRGFGPLPRSLINLRRVIRSSGKVFHLKGDGWANELAQVPSQLFSFWSPSLLGQYRLPETNLNMAVVLTEKTSD